MESRIGVAAKARMAPERRGADRNRPRSNRPWALRASRVDVAHPASGEHSGIPAKNRRAPGFDKRESLGSSIRYVPALRERARESGCDCRLRAQDRAEIHSDSG